MMDFFKTLGGTIEKRWKDANYDEAVFPQLAVAALSEADAVRHVDPWEVVRWLLHSTDIPFQRDVPARFGNPPITLYDGPRFHIDIYYWLDGTTSVHQHSFCGAFQVLCGSSIHSQYRFHRSRQINQHFLVGKMELESVELLERGGVRPILPGKGYIHSLFHLDRPSATICVRTQHTDTGSPQFDYRKPYFAIDPFFSEGVWTKRIQAAALLLHARRPDAVSALCDLLAESDAQTAFVILEMGRDLLAKTDLDQTLGLDGNEQQFQKLVEAARARHGDFVDKTLEVLDEGRRQNDLVHRRAHITNPDHRFFLALLLNIPDRVRMLDLVGRRFPDAKPVDTVLTWVEELSATRVWRGDEPNVLGIPDLDDDYLFVLQCLLEGVPAAQIREAFAKGFSAEYAEALGNKPDELVRRITESATFKALFGNDAR